MLVLAVVEVWYWCGGLSFPHGKKNQNKKERVGKVGKAFLGENRYGFNS